MARIEIGEVLDGIPECKWVQRVQAAAGLSPWAAWFGSEPASPSGLGSEGSDESESDESESIEVKYGRVMVGGDRDRDRGRGGEQNGPA